MLVESRKRTSGNHNLGRMVASCMPEKERLNRRMKESSTLPLFFFFFFCFLHWPIVIDRKRFRPNTRPKIIGRIFVRNEYSASAAENEKVLYSNFLYFTGNFSRESKLLVDIVNVLCMYVLLHINHAHQLQLATATPENHFFPYTNLHFCNVYCLVPNICYRPNIRQLFLDKYSFSAETRKSVFGRSLLAKQQKLPFGAA
jgi:hypothetical protein